MFAVALSTFKEIHRKKIFHFISILTILYLILLGFILKKMGESINQFDGLVNAVLNLSSTISMIGFYFSSMLVGFLTVMLSIGIVSSELENGTILTVLTKPIRRSEYILGKYIGTALLVIIYSTFLYTAVIVISTLSKISLVETFGTAALFKGFLFFILQPLTLLAVCLYGSTICRTIINGILIIGLYMLGLIGGLIEQAGAFTNNSTLSAIGIISSLISPFEVIYRKMIFTIFSTLGSLSNLTSFGMPGASTRPSIWMMVYVCIYLMFFILLSINGFRKRDIG